jgi:hypothetical protein
VIKPVSFALVGCVVVLALGVAWLSQTAVVFIPPEKAQNPVMCRDGEPGLIASDLESGWPATRRAIASEKSLGSGNLEPGLEGSLRFSWLRTFDAPVFIRIDQRAGGKMRLTATQLSGEAGYDPSGDEITKRMSRDLTPAEQRSIRDVLAETKILDQPNAVCDVSPDGAQWLVEARDTHGYRFVSRQSPTTGPVRRLGDFMIGLTGWSFDRVY